MSPEQFMGKKAAGEIDGRTDIYSLGVVLYQMVTAQLPFEGDTPYSLMMQHIQGTVRPPHELAPDLHIPESLSRVILKAIDKSRDLRFQTAEEFIAALDEVATDQITVDPAQNEPPANTAAENVQTRNVQTPNPQTPSAQAINAQATNAQPPSVPVTRRTQPNLTPPPSTPVSQPSASQIRATQPPAAQSRSSQIAPTLPLPQPSVAAKVPTQTPKPSPAFPATMPLPQPAMAAPTVAASASPIPPADSAVVNSAAQHVFIPPRKFQLTQIIALVVLLLAAVLVAGVGYVKYQAYQRLRIENAITARFNAVPALHQAELRVFVSDKREVTLDGKVSSKDDSIAAGDLAASVRGVTSVVNRVEYPPATQAVVPPVTPPAVPAETPEFLVGEGTKFLDDGNYAEAIASFSKAAEADPANQATKELLSRARKAQQTEEQLLKNRHLP